MIMNKEQYRNKRSQYEKYVVMAHSQTHQLGLNYKELEEAINNPNSSNREKYEKIRKLNLHKMESIPVCKIPN